MEDLKTVHHELGHIYYYMLYKDQPFVFRDGANPGFHEAIGDLIALSVTTPEHLTRIGLLNHSEYRVNPTIFNYMLNMALDKVAFLPFGYLVDQWRWRVFSGNISKKEMNRKWWEYRIKYQGISPPVKRSDNDFDPGSKFHIAADTPFMSYFIALILQFQFHRSLCTLEYDTYKYRPHLCDLSGNEMAGKKLRDVLSQGMSVSWKQQLKQLTNEEMSADALLEYFAPLHNDLKKILHENNEYNNIGWNANGLLLVISTAVIAFLSFLVDDYFVSFGQRVKSFHFLELIVVCGVSILLNFVNSL